MPLVPYHYASVAMLLRILLPKTYLIARIAACAIACALGAATVALSADPEWPQAWYEPAKTASELGITTFSQSPLLDDRNLPPVEKRLPDDPVVVVPLDEIGRYGGTARITRDEWLTFPNVESPLTISADMRTFLPNLAESWSVSPDGRTIALKLRAGIKWSDGTPLTSDDFLFVFNDLWLNKEYAPVTERNVIGGKAVKIDDLTFSYVFETPNPLFVNLLAQYGNFLILAKHYYRNFHPGYMDREVLSARIKEMGYISWMAFIYACTRGLIEESVDAPTLDAQRMVYRSPTLARYERNPYYFKIDPQGNQLPYIDAVESKDVENKEVITAMATSGQLDFAAYELRTQDIPLLKLGERTGAIRVHIWNRLHSSDVIIEPNYNCKDKRLRALYWDRRFRIALSLAIDRPEMNEIIYFGRGTPRQITAHPTSACFVPAFAQAYTKYDPVRARALLDEMGLADVNGDGLREYADGTPLTITLEFIDWETPKEITLELVANYWREAGVDLRLKVVDGNLQSARAQAGDMQMTVWHADRVTDILLPLYPDWWVPRRAGWDMAMWNDWARWYQTDGRLGEEPPAVMKQLQAWADEIRTTMDQERRIALCKKILASNAENLWSIGTVGLAPHPVVVTKRLRGMPPKAIWGWDNRWTLSYHPSTWYFDQDETVSEGSLEDPRKDGKTS